MYLRPYNKTKDFEYVKGWITDERTHALWCADLLPYPLTEEAFSNNLAQGERDWGRCGYTFMDDSHCPVGFCGFSVNEKECSGFVNFIVLDSSLRGQGYGTKMLKLLLKYAFEIVGVDIVRLNVFDSNVGARKCYEKVGFEEVATTSDAFRFGEESWGRCLMAAHRQPDILQ